MRKIIKLEVIKGIYWIEIPDTNLCVLCGCPADSVKHLMLRGLILPTEQDGVAFETGPNVILLSDIMLQNGHFSNMAEFPVLQMLYRQGMILPNHPNNTGQKPLIIGSAEMIKAQMRYIYHGNYGLTSIEELLAAGASEKTARQLMRMKLSFAFGSIRKTEELLDSHILGDEVIEIRDGVFLRRKSLNIFEFSYQDESVLVDLNLPKNGSYRSSYPLGFQKIKREYFAVIHSGQGDGWDINRPSMSSILMFQGKVYLIDAGPNLAYCLTALGIGVNEIEGVFQTHCHDDHFAGLATLIRADHRIKLYATSIVRASVTKKLAALLAMKEEDFSNFFEMKNLEFDIWNEIDGMEVMPFLSPHPVETSIFTFRTFWEGGYLSYAHYADIIAMKNLEEMVSSSEAKIGIDQNYYDQVNEHYFTPATLKKIDIGGGLIHGEAEDFRGDTSDRVIFSHTAVPLTPDQKEIGSSAPFGVTDILIPDYYDYSRKIALDLLSAYFCNVPTHHLQKLLNNTLVTFPPGTIFLKAGRTNRVIYLLLSGSAERIRSRDGVYNLLASGEVIGAHSGIHNYPSKSTYRTISYVLTMQISVDVYLEFIKMNKLFMKLEKLHENREFLQKTWLFGEAITYPTQERISKAMKLQHFYNTGEIVEILDHSALCMVKNGSLEITDHEGHSQVIHPMDFFDAESITTSGHQQLQVRTIEPSSVYEIPRSVFQDIPIVLWKLLETFERR